MSAPNNALGKHILAAVKKHDADIGQKQAQLLYRFHQDYIAPLVARIAWLETPWYRRWWLRAKRWFKQQLGKIWKRPTD